MNVIFEEFTSEQRLDEDAPQFKVELNFDDDVKLLELIKLAMAEGKTVVLNSVQL